jgi:hypothetical protein
VTKETISSFDIEDEDYPHPRVGVCRRCWRQFFQRDAFEDHTSNACEKVSKGKREKWQVLYESFTPLVEVTAWDEPVSPTSAPPATSFFPQPVAPTNSSHEGGTISMQEYERLQRERDELRQKNQQLERMANAFLVSRTYQSATAFGSVAQGPRADPLVNIAGSSSNLSVAGPSKPRAITRRSAPSDRDSLVQHMGSQPPEVDVDGLMNEPHENLSRQNSDMSSRSTVHHVTNSPPLPTDEYEPTGDGKGGNHQARAVKPPTSDSGYASHRHGSFGDLSGMPGVADFHRGHNRNSSSMSTLTYNEPQPARIPWRPNAVSGVDQHQHQHQHQNTFMTEPQQQQAQQASEPSFDDTELRQFLDIDIDFFPGGMYDNR